ncbi:iron permease FTR1/Fip1/EfeU [Geopyxis carbonaria]|nr:iron permease FTR1/Fip1/EfeU [Geopyxis carbonaria]
MPNVFAVPVFFIVFRETIETSIIVAVLLSFLKQTLGPEDAVTKSKLIKQVWWGTGLGLFICLVVGCALIGSFYTLGKNLWSGSEDLYEGIFSVLACVIITIMGAAILRVSKLQAKWKLKITAAIEAKEMGGVSGFSKKYAMLLLPLITVLREGLEAVVFIGGVSLAEPASAFPLPTITGLIAGAMVGYIIYRGGNSVNLQWFLIASTMLLYLVAAGLLSKAAWSFDMYQYAKLAGGDVAETGAGPGSYNIHQSVWHVNCCSPKFNGGAGWGVFNSIFGWQNSATYSSVITYNVYWIVVSVWFLIAMFQEKNGHYPFMTAKPAVASSSGSGAVTPDEKTMQQPNERVAEVKDN